MASEIEKQARLMAAENVKADPSIRSVYWLPNDKEVFLIEVTEAVPQEADKKVHPFFFQPSPKSGMPYISGIALVTPQELDSAELPANWGTWASKMKII